jgi:hypothetical protein
MPADALHRFTLAEAIVLTGPAFLMMAYYFWRAKKLGTLTMLTFLLGIGYGLSLELFDIRKGEAYFYTDLRLMVGSAPNWVPLFIGVCWGGILFVAMQTSDRLGLPVRLRPLYDGALAMSLDLVLDPSASNSVFVAKTGVTCSASTNQPFGGMGLWTWCVPENHEALWFSVPVSNFIGWFMVIALASAAVRIVRGPLHAESRPALVQLLMLAAGFAVSAIGLVVTLELLLRVMGIGIGQDIVLAALVLLPLVIVVVMRQRLNFDNRLDVGLLIVPAYLLLWEAGTFFVEGIDRASWPGSAALLVASVLFSALLWLMPSLRRLRPAVAPATRTTSAAR